MEIDAIGRTETSRFEIVASVDDDNCLTSACAAQVTALVDEHGFAIVRGVLSAVEADKALELVMSVISSADRERASFASETDTLYKRRDFCPLPSTPEVLGVCSQLGGRLRRVLEQYCGDTRSILEISTLTSYAGCSHQYIHRDPQGVLCMFAALDDVSPAQGGTVFVPGTHSYSGSGGRHDGKAGLLMRLFQVQCNVAIFWYNFRKLLTMRWAGSATLSNEELKARTFSASTGDNHQPNIIRFLNGQNPVFGRTDVGLRTLVRLFQYGKRAAETFQLVQAAPSKGDVIVYRSDMLHAGPDNRSEKPRFFLNLNIARDVIDEHRWREGYAPHSTLLESPITLGELIAYNSGIAPASWTPDDAGDRVGRSPS